MKRLGLLRLALVAPLLFVPCARAAAATDGWEILKSLAGEWQNDPGPEGPARISYKVISAGSAVVETMQTPGTGPEMITVYHRDGDSLMVTHYCAAGNQPRLRGKNAAIDGKRLEFRFLDVTNLKSPDAVHMRDLNLTLQDSDHMTQEWTSRAKGKDEVTVFRFTRKK